MNKNHGENRFVVRFKKTTEDDISALTEIMKRAFDDEAIRFKGDPKGGGPPGYDDGSFLTKWGITGNCQSPPVSLCKFLVDTKKGEKLVGAFIVFPGEEVGDPGNNILGTILLILSGKTEELAPRLCSIYSQHFLQNDGNLGLLNGLYVTTTSMRRTASSRSEKYGIQSLIRRKAAPTPTSMEES